MKAKRGRDRSGTTRQRLDRKTRRAQLLKCAVAACAHKGLSRTGHADVARLAKVSVPTVFSYFPTRRKLIDEVLKETRRYILEVVHAAMDGPEDAAEKVFAAMWACTTRAKTDRDYFRVWLDWSTAIREDVWPRYVKFQEELIGIYEDALRNGQRARTVDGRLDVSDAARILMGESHMLALMVFSGVEERRIQGFLRHVFSGTLLLRPD